MITYSVNDIVNSNIQNNFLVYSSEKNPSSARNVLFLGACRMTPLMYYFHVLYPEYNLYNIYVPHWTNNSGADRSRIQFFLDNTDYIITETVRNCNIFNTDADQPNNFFETFQTNAPEIRICNLELHMYHHDLHNIFKIDKDKKNEWFIKSRNILKNSLISKKQNFIWNFIEDNIQKVRLFGTQNHPTSILSIATFLFIAQQLDAKLDLSFLEKIADYHFLAGHYTPILSIDIDTYQFKFPCAVFPNPVMEEKNYLYVPSKYETNISSETLNNLLSYL